MRAKITVRSYVAAVMGPDGLTSKTEFMRGNFQGASLKEAIETAVAEGDCHTDTRVILDDRDIGSLWQLKIDPISPAKRIEALTVELTAFESWTAFEAAMKGGYVPTLHLDRGLTKWGPERDARNAKIIRLRELLKSKGFAIYPESV